MRLAAGTERRTVSLDLVEHARWTRGGRFSFAIDGERSGLAVRFPGVRGPGTYTSNGAEVSLTLDGDSFENTHGGACSLNVLEASAAGVKGTLSCVGLGTHAGKGWDVGARFTLRE